MTLELCIISVIFYFTVYRYCFYEVLYFLMRYLVISP